MHRIASFNSETASRGVVKTLHQIPYATLPGEGFRKAQFMAVRVGDVEIALTPFRGARGKPGLQTLLHGVPVHAVHVRYVKDHPAPPRPTLILGRSDEVEIAAARVETGERSRCSAVSNGKTQ